MARPEKNDANYFPHLISNGKKMYAIESKYGNDGYATWYKILEKLCTTEFHFLNLNDEAEIMYLSAKCRVSETLLLSVIGDLAKFHVFNRVLWEESKVIWCQCFVDSLETLYKRRHNKCLQLPDLCKHLFSLGIRKSNKCVHDGNINTQSKVKDSKEEESSSGASAPKHKKSFEELVLELDGKAKVFGKTLTPFVDQYGKEMIRLFYDYWTEPNKSHTQMRWEQENTWDLKRRIERWERNNKITGNGKKGSVTDMEEIKRLMSE